MITNNTASSNYYGIYLYCSNDNRIYNNYFNNIRNNAEDDGNNIWNITPTLGENIIGGSWQGGNYWSDYVGIDANGDGLGDTLLPYNANGNIIIGGDMHPLVPAGFAPLLSLKKSDDTDPVPPGGTINYSISVNNVGSMTTTNVIVTETYDANVTFDSAMPAPSVGNNMWIFPALNTNETRWINISVSVNPSTPIGTVLHNIVKWKGSHHRIPFHFKYGWFTPSYTTNAIERFTPSYTLNDTKLWKASQRYVSFNIAAMLF